MQRARRSVLAVLVLAFTLLGIVGMSPVALHGLGAAAAVGWPVSSGAVIAEVITGGASASDEYVEIANAGPASIDLQNVELVYVASAGTSVTRKASWRASRPLAPGQHLLVANGAGTFAASADVTYASGIAATGGAVALRVIGGTVIDAVGWGDATNSFVEGSPAAAPTASSSIERKPGSGANRTDTNDNSADFAVQAHPTPQNLASAPELPSPTPSASATPSPSASQPPSESPAPSDSPVPTDSSSPSTSPTDSPTLEPTTSPEPSVTEPPVSATTEPVPTDTPTPSATPVPTPGVTDPPTPLPTESPAPTGTPMPTPVSTPTPVATATPLPTPTPTVSPIAIADVRALPDGTTVTVQGVLTTRLGAFDGARGAFLQDATAGIGLYLDATVANALPRETVIRATGTLDQRYSQRILRVAESSILQSGPDALPAADVIRTGDATETFEGRRVTIDGTIVGAPSDVADGVSITLDDGSGQVKIIAATAPAGIVNGAHLRATGPLGQRDSSGTGTSGYRVYALDPSDLVLIAPSPSPSTSPSPSASPSATPSPSASSSTTPSPSPTPSTSPSPSVSPSGPALISISAARSLPTGARVHVRGTVTAESGRVGESLVAIQDASSGLALHLPAGAVAPSRDSVVDVVGDLAAPYGQLEIRPDTSSWFVDGVATPPTPLEVTAQLDEGAEGLLVTITGVVAASPTAGSSGDLSFDVDLAGGARIRVQSDGTSGIAAALIRRGSRYHFTGVVGQHASASGRLDGYRILLRDVADVVTIVDASPTPSPSVTPSTTPGPTTTPRPSGSASPTPVPTPSGPAVITIAAAIVAGGTVAVEGTVTAGSGLLDATGRAIVIQDASAAIEVRLPTGRTVKVGRRIHVVGDSGRSYGAPRILASAIADLGAATVPAALTLTGAPTAAVEWRLVRVFGVVKSLHRSGASWKAEIALGSTLVLIDSLTTAAIPPDRLRVGSTATVTGIVRRPYPTATDRRFEILPRSASDVIVSGTAGSGSTATPRPTSGHVAGPAATPKPAVGRTRPGGATGAASAATPPLDPLDVDLVDLPKSAGMLVRIGGMITGTSATGITVDDGTAVATATLTGDALGVLPQLSVGLAINLIGTAVPGPAPRLTVSSGAGIIPIVDPVAAGSTATFPERSAIPATAGATASELTPSATDPFGLSGVTEDPATDGPPSGGDATLLLVGLLLSLALVGVVALQLRGRPAIRAMAHPMPGTHR